MEGFTICRPRILAASPAHAPRELGGSPRPAGIKTRRHRQTDNLERHRAQDGYSAQASVSETVSAGVALTVKPRRTVSTGAIILSGQVQGPLPEGGVIVELLVHYRGAWVPFRAPRTNSQGHFRVSYRFEGAIGRFPFRAEVPAGQSELPYSSGYSNTVSVSSG